MKVKQNIKSGKLVASWQKSGKLVLNEKCVYPCRSLAAPPPLPPARHYSWQKLNEFKLF